jgi:hypothetical protein
MSADQINRLVLAVCAMISLTSIGGTIFIVHHLTKRVASRAVRYSLRAIAIVLATFGVAPRVLESTSATFERGDFVCLTCGHAVNRSKLLAVTFRVAPAVIPRGIPDSDDSYRALLDSPSEKHGEHDWMAVGCYSEGLSGIACTELSGTLWFAALPKLSDRDWARRIAQHFVAKAAAERSSIVSACDRAFGGCATTDDEFERWYEDWRHFHPDWPAREQR